MDEDALSPLREQISEQMETKIRGDLLPPRIILGWDYGPQDGAVVLATEDGGTIRILDHHVTTEAYPDLVRHYVSDFLRAQQARGDIALVRILARFPWALHLIADTPTWRAYAADVKEHS